MNSLLRRFVAFVTALAVAWAGTAPAYAQTNVCTSGGIAFGFFNGVQTTDAQATTALLWLRAQYGRTLPRTGESIRYEKFYNYSNGFEDFVETFEQRLQEQDRVLAGRFELFMEVISGSGPWWGTIVNTVVGTVAILDGIWQEIQAQMARNLTTLFANPPTTVNYAEHRLRIDNYVIEGKKMVFFAHSQGNLFVTPATDYARARSSADSVKVVHVAPASPTLRGPYVLADKDLVINALRVAGSVASSTDIIPGYLLRPAGSNGQTDILGHGLNEIYTNTSLAISGSVRDLVSSALNTVAAPPQQTSAGFFTATLTWDGTGDVDLHTFEPDDARVYYGSPVGRAGYLDVDNTVANGPEHYYASCEASRLQLGTYRVRVANYARADGRTATVQIASSKDGVLGTRSVVLGGETGSDPVVPMFNVIVSRDVQTGEYSVSVQ